MTGFEVRRHDRSEPLADAVVELVQTAGTGPPYDYAVEEMAPASEWFTALVRAAMAVRTLAGRHAAFALYERLGFAVVRGVQQVHLGRPRVFLTRTIGAPSASGAPAAL